MAKLFIDTISISGSRIGRPSRSSKFQLTRCELTTTTMTTPTTTIRTPGNSERLEYSRGQNSSQSVFSNSVRLQHRKGREVLFMGFEDCFYFFSKLHSRSDYFFLSVAVLLEARRADGRGKRISSPSAKLYRSICMYLPLCGRRLRLFASACLPLYRWDFLLLLFLHLSIYLCISAYIFIYLLYIQVCLTI